MAELLEAVVVGAGVSGLACARRISSAGGRAVVVEAGRRVGGVIDTLEIDGFRVEAGPNTVLPTQRAMEQIVDAGLEKDMVAAPRGAPRYVWVGGGLRRVPWVLSPRGTFRALAEPFVSRRSGADGDESAASFFRRRFGVEVRDRLAAPFISGIYAGDTQKLSLAGAFPRLAELESRYGSVILGMLLGRRDAPRRYPLSSFRNGMRVLPEGLASGLEIRFEMPVRSVRKDGRAWMVDTEGESLRAQSVVVATPAGAAQEILKDAFPDLAGLLGKATYAPVAVVAVGVDDEAFPRPLDGFGVLIPRTEGLYTLGTQFNSCLFPGRAPEGKQLLTNFIGGALFPEILDWTDDRIRGVVSEEVERVLSLRTGAMVPVALFRYERAIPQYGLGHPEWKSAVKRSLERTPGLFLGGNYIEGISVPASIENGLAAGECVLSIIRRK